MKKPYVLISLVILILNTCVPLQTSLPATLATIVNSTATESHTLTPRPTITRRSTITPTITPTPTSTLSPEQYPKLQNLVLTVDNLSADPESIFAENFVGPSWKPIEERKRPVIRDLTQELIANGKCELDCSRQSWSVNGLAIYITMIRANNTENALLLSKNHFDGLGTKVWDRLPEITYLYEGIPAPPHTWVVDINEHYQSLGTAYGTIFILIDRYMRIRGDDFTTDVDLMLDAANLQIAKLELVGIPANP